MARNNTSRNESIVTLNAKAAEVTLDALREKAKAYRREIDAASKAGDATKVQALNKELKSIEQTTSRIKSMTYDYNRVLKNLNGSSINELTKTARLLNREINQLSPGTQTFIEKSKQLDLVRNRISQLNGRAKESHNWLSRAGNSFNKYWGLATTAVATITGMSFALRGAAQSAAKMDDVYADVMKTTGLLRDDVVELNKEFQKMNTRTSREDLNLLARDAGKLGISAKEDVLQFVKAANQINVALGEDLGEGAIRNIGKISEVFQKTKELGIEKAFLSIGSAINALGQASTASEEYLVDFTQRLAGTAYQSGMSVQNVLGWASALDQTGNKVEMSATAFQNFIMKMFSETETFAKMANMSLQDFSSLLQTDVNQAIITVLTAMNQKGGFAQLVPMFKEMGADGARAVSVLSSLATNIGLVTEAQKLSNVEYQKATSLTNEYNVKNETRQAQLDKAKKAFKDQVILLGEQLSPAFLKSTNAGTLFLKAIMSISKEFVYAALVLAGLITAYKFWGGIVSITKNIVSGARAVNLLFAASLALVQGNTVRAAAAWKMFGASFSATGIGAIITAITALGYGLYKLITYETELTKITRNYYAETEKAERSAGQLLDVLRNSAVGSREYKEALEALQEDYGPYIESLINENGALTNIETARVLINNAIRETIALRVQEQAINEVVSKSLDKQSKYYEKMVDKLMQQGGLTEDVARITAKSFADNIKAGMAYETAFAKVETSIQKTRKIAFNTEPFQSFTNHYKQMVVDIENINKRFDFLTPNDNSYDVPIPGGETSAQFKARRIKEEEEKKRIEAEIAAMSAEEKEKRFKSEMQHLENLEKEKLNVLKKGLLEGQITKEDYEQFSLVSTISMLERRIQLHKKYGKETSDLEGEYYDAMIKSAEITTRRAEEIAKIGEAWMKKLQSFKEEAFEEDQDIDSLMDDIVEKQKQLDQYAKDVRKRYGDRTLRKEYQKDLADLKEIYKQKKITTEQYEWELGQIRLKHAEKIASAINSVVNSIADLYQTLRDAEFDQLERQKEQELRLYGNTADKRAEIEQKFEKEKLELQIEYADKDMAIKILQTVSAGALAAIQAVAQLGPIAGPIAAALIAATTAIQIGTIIAQRNALKSNLNSELSASSSPAPNLRGYSEGGYTGSRRSDKEPVGIVHANEWVAPAAMVRANPVVFRNLERERVSRYSFQSPPKQFASGGFTSGSGNSKTDILLANLIIEVKKLNDRPLKTYVVLNELNAIQETRDKFKRQGSL